MERFNSYKLCVNAEAYNNIVPEELEAKYNALTKEVSDSLDELNSRLKRLTHRVTNKENDLSKKTNNNITEEEYENVYFSDEQYEHLEEQINKTGTALNAAIENNDKLAGVIAGINKDIDYGYKQLEEKTGYKELLPKDLIADVEFDKRINLKKHDIGVIRKEIDNLTSRKMIYLLN